MSDLLYTKFYHICGSIANRLFISNNFPIRRDGTPPLFNDGKVNFYWGGMPPHFVVFLLKANAFRIRMPLCGAGSSFEAKKPKLREFRSSRTLHDIAIHTAMAQTDKSICLNAIRLLLISQKFPRIFARSRSCENNLPKHFNASA